MSYLPSIYLLWLSVCSNLLSIYLFSCCFLIIESLEFFIYSIYMSLIRYIVCKFFLLVCSLSFHSLNSVSWRGEFWWSLIYQDFLLWIMLFMLCLERLCFNSRLKKFLFSFRISSFRFSIIFRSTSMRLMFIYGVKYDLEVICLHLDIQLFQYRVLKSLAFLQWILYTFVKNQQATYGLISGRSILFHGTTYLSLCQHNYDLISVIL